MPGGVVAPLAASKVDQPVWGGPDSPDRDTGRLSGATLLMRLGTIEAMLSEVSTPVEGICAAKLLQCDELAARRGYVGPRGRSWIQGDVRYRLVRGERWERPETETFDEFIVGHLKYVLGPEWGKRQVALPREKQHVVVRWMFDAAEYHRTLLPAGHRDGDLFNVPPSGSAMEMLSLADDVYRLSLIERLPTRVLKRLRAPGSFQGMRYELSLAAAFTRAGFTVDWLDETSTKHGEFTISFGGKDPVLVEAKSRHRPGTMHQPGLQTDHAEMRADVIGLYARALKKETKGLPFLICIDVNLPHREEERNRMPSWAEHVRPLLDERPPTQETPAKEFCLAFTNLNWHYSSHRRASGGSWIYTFPTWTQCAPREPDTYVGILQAFDHQTKRPEGPF
mgnify:CR=1 FL=1